MICRYCGATVPGGSVYCNMCGQRLARKKREKKPEGVVKQLKPWRLPSGNWRIQVEVDGQRKSKTFPTAEDAAAWAQAVRAGLIKAKDSNALTVKLAYSKYLDASAPALSPSTYRSYKSMAKNTMQGIMPRRVSELSSEHVQREIAQMAKAGKSAKYIRNAVALLGSVLGMFRPELELRLNFPEKKKKEPRRITEEEMKKLIAAAKGTDMELPLLMALWMGMRMSEIRGAVYGDVDGDALHICRAVVQGPDGAAEKPPKTAHGDRWVNIPPYIKSLLRPSAASGERIVPMTQGYIYHHFTRLCEAAGIEHARFHDLRHANAAVMVGLDVPSKYAQMRNGWADEKMYKEQYAYTQDKDMKKFARRIDRHFKKLLTPDEQTDS